MVRHVSLCLLLCSVMLISTRAAFADPAGGLRGTVYDKDFEVPLPGVRITIAELTRSTESDAQGNYVFVDVPPGRYTLVFFRDRFVRQVKADVVVQAGALAEVNVDLVGDFTDMEEFVVQDLEIGGGTEAAGFELRAESPGLLDVLSSELMSQAGAGDVASALTLVAGATVQDGKFAVIRGLPDRFVSSQINGIVLPSADEDTRAAELDQFPSMVVESVQVSKTFTPDQQGNASGGAVNVVLKGIPDQNFIAMGAGYNYNTQTRNRDDFLTYRDGNLGFFGRDGVRQKPMDGIFDGALGVSRGSAPIDYSMDFSVGARHEFDTGLQVGAIINMFYDRSSLFYDDGIDDKYSVADPGDPMTPQLIQRNTDPLTQLFDVTRGVETVKYGGLASAGASFMGQELKIVFLETNVAENLAVLSEDTRGRDFEDFFGETFPFLRSEAAQYEERTTDTLQLSGRHVLPLPNVGIANFFVFLEPELDWTYASSSADRVNQKRLFGSQWTPGATVNIPGFPPIIVPPRHTAFKAGTDFILGNAQIINREITEDSTQYNINLKFPFEQWTGDEGYIKVGLFRDRVERSFKQDTFSNFANGGVIFNAEFDQFMSEAFFDLPTAGDIIAGSEIGLDVDVDYEGKQNIDAHYVMIDLPLTSQLKVIAGLRYETTEITVRNFPGDAATWIPVNAGAPTAISPGDTDVDFYQEDRLPSVSIVFQPWEPLVIRAAYSETVARQTFKELTPIQQQEFFGSDIFVGNPDLQMAAVTNYDLRVDYTPYPGGFFSLAFFQKDVERPIEFVQEAATFVFTRPVNYPEGRLRGVEVEVRQQLGHFWDRLEGLSVGGNITFIDSVVTLPEDQAAILEDLEVPTPTRNMTNAPEFLYNFFLTYNYEPSGTQVGLFYSVRGDTLIAGDGQSGGEFIPAVFQDEVGTLNFKLTQKLGEYVKLSFSAKNLTNPLIREVYRSSYIGDDVVKTSYRKGIDLSVSLSAEIPF